MSVVVIDFPRAPQDGARRCSIKMCVNPFRAGFDPVISKRLLSCEVIAGVADTQETNRAPRNVMSVDGLAMKPNQLL